MGIALAKFESSTRGIEDKYAYTKNNNLFKTELKKSIVRQCSDASKSIDLGFIFANESVMDKKINIDSLVMLAAHSSEQLQDRIHTIELNTLDATYFVGAWHDQHKNNRVHFYSDGTCIITSMNGKVRKSTWSYQNEILMIAKYKPKTYKLIHCDYEHFEYMTGYKSGEFYRIMR